MSELRPHAQVEPTVHILEITDPDQKAAAIKGWPGRNEPGPFRVITVAFTAVNRDGIPVLLTPPPGYGVWIQTDELLAETLEGLADRLPVSVPWSQAPVLITEESLESEITAAGITDEKFQFLISDGERPMGLPLTAR